MDLVQPGAELTLFKPRPATRTASGGTAQFVFALASPPTTPITVDVLDAGGAVINTSQVTGRVGLNRTSWNLVHAAPTRPVLRSIPPDNPYIWEAGRWQNRERPVTHWGLGAAGWQPRAAPGSYTVRMTYNGRQYSQPFEVWRDVTLPSTEADLVASSELQRNVVTAINDVVDKINRIEIMRMQVEDLRKQHTGNRQLDQALADIYKRMYDTELHYLSRTEMHSDDKWYVEKYKLYLNLVWLLAEIGGSGGDVAGGVAYRPTNASVAVFQDRLREMEAAKADFDALMREVETFNRNFSGRLPPISDRLTTPVS
jgi:hypothetical protein